MNADCQVLGWDAGAWMTANRDGFCLLQWHREPRALFWSGGISNLLLAAQSLDAWLDEIFSFCGAAHRANKVPIVIAIDAPFALPQGITDLIGGLAAQDIGRTALANPYLFRRTERYVKCHINRNPLSSLQDRIGSQTTKVMHFLRRFGFTPQGSGVWETTTVLGTYVQAIETYPALCKLNANWELRPQWLDRDFQQCRAEAGENGDQLDALICALIARAFAQNPDLLVAPPMVANADFHPDEGWIWHPRFPARPQ